MKQYIDLITDVMTNGSDRTDRTGVGTRSVFGRQMRFDLRTGKFPAVTSKKLAWKAVVSELLWIIEGSGDERRLCEILHGTRDDSKTTVWTANANADYWTPKAKFKGDLGVVYGKMWRSWPKTPHTFWEKLKHIFVEKKVDQLSDLIDGIKNDPYGRRHIITAWNPSELENMALPPCHMTAQFYVVDGELSCQLYQRSVDIALGLPFNIASYSLLTYMIAQVCGLKVGDFVWTGGDCHIYKNHFEGVKIQVMRDLKELPTLSINPEVSSIYDFKMEDFDLVGYDPHGPIKMQMAV